MKGARHVFRFLAEAQRRGERTALVTLTDVIGSSSRSPGTHMGVSETGASIGSFSGGCVEAAVVAEARRIIAEDRAELVRFGAGSPYIDIRLPCGGGIDLLFTPLRTTATLDRAADLLEQRQAVTLRLDTGGELALYQGPALASAEQGFSVRHDPDLRVIILGHGAEPLALARQVLAFGADPLLLSPDRTLLDEARRLGVACDLLRTPGRSAHLATADALTAIVFLFHDHDWEPDLLVQALEGEAFYIGAMGSRATQARRTAELAERRLTPSIIARIAGPIGLIPAARDPDTLALSVMAELVASHTGTVGADGLRSSRPTTN